MPEDFSDRDGYDKDFLGSDYPLPLPALGVHEADAVTPDDASDDEPQAFRYRHFSVILSRSRKFCRVTAVNINGEEPFFRIPRRGWRLDPRGRGHQQDDEVLYGPDTFSRGHMVRRNDPLWGTQDLARQANSDTFYFTNSVPQVQSFNDGLWGDLEDHILEQGKSRGSKLTVFTGPIMTDNDPLYVQGTIAVPRLFYKLVVAVKEAGDGFLAAAFVQSQEDVMPVEGAFPAFDPGPFTPYQVKVSKLEDLTGLDFGLQEADVLTERDDLEPFGATGLPGLPLRRPEQIIFG